MDTWHDMGQAFKLWIRLKSNFWAENNIFFCCKRESIERKSKIKGEAKGFSLRSTKFRRLEFVKPRVKVQLLDEG